MPKYETQITAYQTPDGHIWYTAWIRRSRFLWRGRWKMLTPIYLSTYGEAAGLTARYNF